MLLAGTEAHRERDYDATRGTGTGYGTARGTDYAGTGTGAYGTTGTDQYDPVTKKPITQKIAEAIPGGCRGGVLCAYWEGGLLGRRMVGGMLAPHCWQQCCTQL